MHAFFAIAIGIASCVATYNISSIYIHRSTFSQYHLHEHDNDHLPFHPRQLREPEPTGAASADTVVHRVEPVEAGGVPVAAATEEVAKVPAVQRYPTTSDGTPKYHIVVTADSATYVKWQCRVNYYYYKKVKAQYPDSPMGGYTRLLHGGKEDNLMDEIPTVVVEPLSTGDFGYVVLNRPHAFEQWLDKYQVEEEYIMMLEPDHVLLKPIPNWATQTYGAAFPFFYINPKEFKSTINKFNNASAPIETMDPIGNSPVCLPARVLKKIVPVWATTALEMKRDSEASAKFGWVLEMYAYSVASAQFGFRYELHPEYMLQPPWDEKFFVRGCTPKLGAAWSPHTKCSAREAFIIHFTYGNDYDLNGKFTPGKFGQWRFDKRSYMARPPPRDLKMPPKGTNPVVVKLIESINEASAALPAWDTLGLRNGPGGRRLRSQKWQQGAEEERGIRTDEGYEIGVRPDPHVPMVAM